MDKHTPGPLAIDHDKEAMASYVLSSDDCQGAIAQCSWTTYGVEKEEAMANAVLFAAAPDMVEELEMTLNEVLAGAVDIQTVKRLRATIAKAKEKI